MDEAVTVAIDVKIPREVIIAHVEMVSSRNSTDIVARVSYYSLNTRILTRDGLIMMFCLLVDS